MKLRLMDYVPGPSSINGLIRVLDLAHVKAVRGIAERHLYVDHSSPMWTRIGRAIVTLIPGVNLGTALYDFVFYILGTPKSSKIAQKGTGTSQPPSTDSVQNLESGSRSEPEHDTESAAFAPPETEWDKRARASVNALTDELSVGQVESGSRSSMAVPPTPRSSVASEVREPMFHDLPLEQLSGKMKELSTDTLEAMCELLLCVRNRFLASCEERGDWTQLMQSLGCHSVYELVDFYWTRDSEVAVRIGESNRTHSLLRYLYYVKNQQWLKALQVLPKHDDGTIAVLLGNISGDERCPLGFRQRAATWLSYYYKAIGSSKEAETWLKRAFLLGEDVSVLYLLVANASNKILKNALENKKDVKKLSLTDGVVVPYLMRAFDEVELEGKALSDELSKPWPRFKYAPSKRAVDRMVALYSEKLNATQDIKVKALVNARLQMIRGLETYDAQCEIHSREKSITEEEAYYMYRVTPADERGLGGMLKKDYYAYVAIALGSDSVPIHYAYTMMSKLSPTLKAAALERVKARSYQSDAICLAALMEEQGWGGKQIPLPGTPKTLGIVNEFVSPDVVRILHEVYGETLPNCFSGIRREIFTDLSPFATSERPRTRASLPDIEAMLDVMNRSLAEAVANLDPSCDEYLNGFYERAVSLLVQHYEEKGQFEEVARVRALTMSELMKYYKKYDHPKALKMCQSDKKRQQVLEAIFVDPTTPKEVKAQIASALSRVVPEKAYTWMMHAYKYGSSEVSFLALLAAAPKKEDGSITPADALQLRTLAECYKEIDPYSAGFYAAYASGTITDSMHPSTMMRDEVRKLAEREGKAEVAQLVSQLKTHDDICREILADGQASDMKKRRAARDLFDITLAYIHNARSTEGGDANHWGYLARLYGDQTIPLHHCFRDAYLNQENLPQVRAWLEEEKGSNPSAAYLSAMMHDLGLGGDKAEKDPFMGLTGAVDPQVKEILLTLYPKGHTRHKQMNALPTTAYVIEALV